jgi:death-on-curing protein
MTLLSADQVVSIHNGLVRMFAQSDDPIVPFGPRELGLIESACARPDTALGNTEKYKTLPEKAAALFHSLVKNHPFHNGNKRTALVSLVTCLFRNHRTFRNDVTDDEVFDFVLAVADNRFPNATDKRNTDEVVGAISRWIRDRTIRMTNEVSELETKEFIARCEGAGASYKKSGSSHVITGPEGSVRVAGSTRKLAGNVVKQYFRRLGLTQSKTGITTSELVQGVSGEQGQMRRFRNVLNRLANA